MQAEALEDGVSLTTNFLSKQASLKVMPHLEAYIQRRSTCEHILGRRLSASDNLMKFCCHGGRLSLEAAHSMLAPKSPAQAFQSNALQVAAQ